jgi:hypothetical protein
MCLICQADSNTKPNSNKLMEGHMVELTIDSSLRLHLDRVNKFERVKPLAGSTQMIYKMKQAQVFLPPFLESSNLLSHLCSIIVVHH